jgi:DegV family protein with EDD domain
MSDSRQVTIVTDSTADLPPELVARHGIHVVAQNVIWGGQTYRDRIDMDSPAFYARLRSDPEFPKTSQPSVGAFQEVWRAAAGPERRPILSVHVSGSLSGTVATAETAREQMADYPIEIIDSRSVSLALGYAVLAAARLASAGHSPADCAAAVRAITPHMQMFFMVDTLEYLHRGGRIGGATRLLGTMLNLKPLMQIIDGRVEPLERVRTRGKALEKMVETARARAGEQPVRLGVLHVAAAAEAARLAETLRGQLSVTELLEAEATPAIGAHVGPGMLGMVLYPATADPPALAQAPR